jgi:ribonucleoside-diphosphate reductase alpha chain
MLLGASPGSVWCDTGLSLAFDGEKVDGTVVETADMNTQKVVEEIQKKTLDYFNGDEMRARVFMEKYMLKDANGNGLETTPEDMWRRIAREISSVEATVDKKSEWEEKFKWLMQEFKFVPGGRIMFGAGRNLRVTLLNCYVIPIKDDSIEAIFDWCKEAARTYSYGGGAGTDLSILRPKGANVNNAAVHSTGSVSFMEVMSETTHTIGQSGRRGALMITISVEHPDVFDFIRIKRDLKSVRYANISVRVTDAFMHAVEDDKDFMLHFENGVTGRVEKKIRARDLWNEIIKSARDWAEPGIMFWDTIKRYSPSEYNGMEVLTTNPCSEQPLEPYGACDLGNINLSAFVSMPFTDKAELDWETLGKSVRYAVRFLDDVLDYNSARHPLKAQAEAGARSRRIGLGITGMADMLVKLKIKYDSDKALAFADQLFNEIKTIAYDESCEIAREKGTFKAFDKDKHLSMPFVMSLSTKIKDKIAQTGLRNVAMLTMAPVGSGSVLAGTSSGIEPIFAFSYTRRSESLSKNSFKVYHPLVKEYMSLAGITDDSALPDFFVPAHKILPEFRVKMQGVIQRHIDSAISSTVNLPSDTTTDQVGQIYMQAWKAGCKSISVYREGSREGVLITEEEEKRKIAALKSKEEWERPQMMTGRTIKLRVTQGTLYLTADFEGERIREVFINLGKAGSDEKSYAEAMGRLISKYLQLGGDIKEVIESLKGIRSTTVMWEHGLKIYSVPDAIAKALEIAIGDAGRTKPLVLEESAASTIDGIQQHIAAKDGTDAPRPSVCPACSETALISENGCFICKNCGYTKCE